MSLLRSVSDGLRSLFRKEQVSQELDEELSGFLEMAAEEKMKQGMSRKDAVRAVRLERGSLEVTKEVVRSAGLGIFFADVLAGPAHWRTNAPQESRLHYRRSAYLGAGDWGKQRCIQHSGCSADSATALSPCRTAREGRHIQ